MADIESNINIDINTSDALAGLRALQREISVFHQTMAKSGAVSNAKLANMQQNLTNGINATGQFSASMQTVKTTTESFTSALEKNKLSMGQYFRYAGSQVGGFRKLFSTEFDTIEKVARERVKTLQTQYIKLGRDANGAMKAIAVRPQVLDMKDLGTQTAIAAQKAQIFNQLMRQGSTELLNFGKNTQWAGRQLMVGFTVPLGIMGAAAAREFMKMEEQVIRLQRVYGDFTTTAGETDVMTESIKNLGIEFTKYGVAVEKTIGLAADAAAMGKTGVDLVAQVTEATRLAVLGGVEQQQALDTTISLQNAFGVSSDKLAGKINFLNAVENQTATSIQDLTEAIPKAGPVVQQLGGSVEDLAFFMTAMKEGGIDASEGANALKSGLASLINPTGEAVTMLESFGINLNDIVNRNAGNVSGLITEFARSLDTLDPLNRAQAIEGLFGKFQFARMSTLFQNVIAEGSQASRVLELTKNSATELAMLSQRELAKVEASPMYKFQAAVESFKASLAPVGEEFLKAVTPIINFGTEILNKFNEMSDGGKQFAVILTGVVAGIGPVLLMTFGLIANGVANLIKGFMFVRGILTGAGKSSNMLAEQLNYMTTEQLEAAAVASSLGQVHSSLIQTFNAEAGAVRNLAGAYGSAIGAQSAFMGPILTGGGGTRKTGPKKLAEGGIISGPGSGTSDSIPAMLSNGEAVISAAIVKKYPALVNGLIAGQVSHFASAGIVGEGPSMFGQSGNMSAQASHWGMFTPSNLAATIGEIGAGLDDLSVTVFRLGDKLEDGTRQVTTTVQKLSTLASESGDLVSGGMSYPGTTTIEPADRNQAYNAAGIAGAGFTLEEVSANGRAASAALESQSAASIRYSNELQELVAEGIAAETAMSSTTSAQTRFNFMLENAEKTLVEAELGSGRSRTAEAARVTATSRLAEVETQFAALLASGVDEETALQKAKTMFAAKMLGATTGEFAVGPTGTGGGSLRDVSTGRGRSDLSRVFSPGESQNRKFAYGGKATSLVASKVFTDARASGASIADSAARALVGGIKSILKIKSPSIEMDKAGRDAGKGLMLGVKSTVPEAEVAGKQVATAVVKSVQTQALKDANKNTNPAFGRVAAGVTPPSVISPSRVQNLKDKMPRIVGSVPNLRDAQMGAYGGTNMLKGQELQFARGAKLLDSAQMLKPINMLNAAMKTTANGVKIAAINVKDFGLKAGVAAKTFSVNMTNSMKQLANSAKETAVSIGQSSRQMAMSVGRGLKNFASGGKLGMMGMAASGGLMMASGQEGALGDVARTLSGPLMAISSVASVLSMIPGPAGLVVAGLAAVAGGFIAYNVAMDNAKKSGQELAESMSTTKEKLDQISSVTGKESISGLASAERSSKLATMKDAVTENAKTAATEFKQQIADSEIGKQFLADIKTQVSNGKSMSEIADNMASQLSFAVADGLMTKEQADLVAEVLGQSLKNKKFEIELKGNLSEIVGSNGENLLNNPGAVANTLTAKSNQQATSAGTYAVQKEQEFTGSEQIATVGQIAAAGGAAVAAGGVAAGILATSGALLGVTAGSAATGVGAPIAVITGTAAAVLGLTAAIWGSVEANIENAKNAQLAATQYNEAYLQNLKMVDIINQRYSTLISEKQAQLSVATTEEERLRLNQEISALQATQTNALDRQRQAQTQLIANAVKTKEGLGETTWDDAQKKQIETTYKDDVVMQELAKKQYDRASNESVLGNETTQATLEIQIASGAIDPSTSETLLNALSGNTDLQANYNLLMTQEGDATTIQMVNSLVAVGATEETIEKHINLVATGQEDAAELIELTSIAADLQASGINISIETDADMNKLKEIKAGVAEVETMFANGPVTGQVISDFLYKTTGFDLSADQQAYFDSLPPEAQKEFTTAYLTVIETIDTGTEEGKARLRAWAAGKGEKGKTSKYYDKGNVIKGAKYDYNAIAADMKAEAYTNAQASAAQVQASAQKPPPTGPQNTGPSGGGSQEPEKAPTSFMDDLVAQMRKVSKGAQSMTENFADSWAAISGMFGGGARSDIFNGLEQQLRRLGAGQDLIEKITGMSQEEYDQRKNDLFDFDAAGNITGFKSMMNAMNNAFRSFALASFQSKQQQSIKTANDQTVAIRKLVAAGYSYAEAFKIAEDAAVADAIANGATAESISEVARVAREAERALSNMAAAQSLANSNADVTNRAATLSFIETYASNLTDAQQAAILTNDQLATMAANFNNLDAAQLEVFRQALANADLAANVEIRVNSQTIGGLEKIFSDGFSKAMEQFAAKEKEINFKFDILKEPFDDAVKMFEDRIEDLRNAPGGLDDLEADLQRISEQEVDINKKYEDRRDALDQIAKANDRIVAQQRSQLSIADALSQGDLAAAARAAAELNAQQAQQAAQDQKDALDKSQELEIARLTGTMGLTREQIEARVRDIKTQIFNLEEQGIEPARRQLELLDRQKQVQIEALEVLGMTKREWENVELQIALAKTQSDSYNEAMGLALEKVAGIMSYWNDLDGKEVSTIHTIIERRVTEVTPAPAPAPVAAAPAAPADYHTEEYRNNMARAVIRGNYGNGQARRNALGADYQWIQDRVNDMVYHRNGYAKGGLVSNYLANGGFPGMPKIGTDTVPAMLTPGEFVMTKYAVDAFGASNLKAINNGTYSGGSVYNNTYSISVNVKSDANANEIARTVMAQIKQVDSQRIRGNRF